MFIYLFLLLWLKTLKPRLFFMPIYQDQSLGSNAKVCVTYSINANVAIIINNFQQKYVVLTAMRRTSGISKILLIKILKSKVYVLFQISLLHNITSGFWSFIKKSLPQNSSRTPRNGILPFLDSSRSEIFRGIAIPRQTPYKYDTYFEEDMIQSTIGRCQCWK